MGAVMVQTGTVMAVNISVKRGEKKHDVGEAYLQEGMGITTDAHRGEWHRQVNLLSLSSVEDTPAELDIRMAISPKT